MTEADNIMSWEWHLRLVKRVCFNSTANSKWKRHPILFIIVINILLLVENWNIYTFLKVHCWLLILAMPEYLKHFQAHVSDEF